MINCDQASSLDSKVGTRSRLFDTTMQLISQQKDCYCSSFQVQDLSQVGQFYFITHAWFLQPFKFLS